MKLKMMRIIEDNRNGKGLRAEDMEMDDVNYITVERLSKLNHPIPVFHTSYAKFIAPTTLQEAAEAYVDDGIKYADNSTLISEQRVKKREKTRTGLLITFVDDTTVEVAKRSRKR